MNQNKQKLRAHCIMVSLDGYAAGPNQSAELPFGENTTGLTDWFLNTHTGRKGFGLEGGEKNLDDEFVVASQEGIGATIMGRNMFGPVRGDWKDETWKGWWGENPVYHHPVFILTHHPRASMVMQGGTTFHFVSEGIEVALARAFEAAQGKDVRLGGGAATIQQYLRAGLLDEMHLVYVPMLIGGGERLFDNLGGPIGYECTKHVSSEAVMHAVFTRKT